MSTIDVVSRWRLQEGRLDKAIELARKAVAIVREKDSGTVRFAWYLCDDKKTITILETYESSEAALAHLGNIGEVAGAIMQMGSLEIQIFGDPSEALLQAAAPLGPKVHSMIATL